MSFSHLHVHCTQSELSERYIAPKNPTAFTEELLQSFQRDALPKLYKLMLNIFLPSNTHSSLTKLTEVEFCIGAGNSPFPPLCKVLVRWHSANHLCLGLHKALGLSLARNRRFQCWASELLISQAKRCLHSVSFLCTYDFGNTQKPHTVSRAEKLSTFFMPQPHEDHEIWYSCKQLTGGADPVSDIIPQKGHWPFFRGRGVVLSSFYPIASR